MFKIITLKCRHVDGREASKLPLEAMERTQYPVDPRKLASHPDVEGGIQSPYLQKVFIPF